MVETISVAKDRVIEKMMKRINEEYGGTFSADFLRQCMNEMENELGMQ